MQASTATAARPQHVSVGESIARGALALLSTQPVTWAGSLLAAAVVPRLLGAEALGQYTAAISITTLGSTAASLGISDYIVRRIAQRGESVRYDIAVALMVQTAAAAICALAIAAIVPLIGSAVIDPRLLALVLVGMIAAPAQGLLLSMFRGREQHVHYAWINAGCAVLTTVGGVLALVAGADLITFAGATVAVALITTLAGWKLSDVHPAWPALNRELLDTAREFVRGGLPFVSWSLTLSIYGSIDRVMLGFLVPASELGWYAAAYRIIGITVFIPSIVVAPLFPALSRGAQQPDVLRRAIAQTLRVTLLFSVPISAGIIVLAPAVPALLGWPADFANAVPLMIILSLHIPVVAVDMVLAGVIMAIGGEARWVRVGVIASVFNIGVNLVCIPLTEHIFGNGAVGASLATVLTELLMCVGALILIPKHLLQSRTVLDVARILCGGAATVVVGAALQPVCGVFVAAAAGAATYAIVCCGLGTLTIAELREFPGLLARYAQRGARNQPSELAA